MQPIQKFSYSTIDDIPEGFYAGMLEENGFLPLKNKKVVCEINGKSVTVNIQLNRSLSTLWNRYSRFLLDRSGEGESSEDGKVYDPIDADEKFHANMTQYRDDYGNLRTEMLVVPGTAELSKEQIKKRVLAFIKIMHIITSDDGIAEIIAEAAPKKKDGSLYVKRIVHIATCFCQRTDLQMREIYAQAKSDSELLISSRLETHTDVSDLDNDLIVTTNLFRD